MTSQKRNIFWLIIIRLIIVTSLLVATVIIQLSTSEFIPIIPFYYLVVLIYLLSFGYFLLYTWNKHFIFQAYLQLLGDLFLVTALVYISGGLAGSLYFLYLFPIIGAGLVVSRRAAYLAAGVSAVFFGVMVDGLYFRIIPYFMAEQERTLTLGLVLFTMFLAWSVFFLVAFLAGHLAESLRKTREELRLAQKELEVKERLASAGRVAAQLAHEIRNPLAAVSGAVQVLKSELALEGEHKSLMEMVLQESNRISGSIEQFLDLASPGKRVFYIFDLVEVLKESLVILQAGGDLNHRFKVEGNFSRATGIRYYGNAAQFKQVFWNLAKNACKAMPDGGTLTIDIQDAGKEIRIRFADTGRGLSEDEKEHLFEPFYSGFADGRGLGMTVVRRIVDDYDGRIEVRSVADKGTDITIILPVKSSRIVGAM